MNVLFDTGILLPLIQPDIQVPIPEGADAATFDAEGRINYLMARLAKENVTIIIPTPVISELLVKETEHGADALTILQNHPNVKIVPFDTRAAVECALLQRSKGVRLGLEEDYRRSAAKVDAQIISTGAVEQIDVAYCADGWMKKAAESLDIKTISFEDLPLPPEDDQKELDV